MTFTDKHHGDIAFPAVLLSSRVHQRALMALCFVLGGMLAVPMLPGWQGAARLLTAVLLMLVLSGLVSRGVLRVAAFAVGVAALLVALSWVQSALTSPGRHVIGALTDVYGLALPLYGGIALTVLDLLLLAGLSVLLLSRATLMRVKAGFALALIVWAYSLSGPLVNGPGAPDLLPQMLAGSSEWAGWVLLMGLCLTLVRGPDDIRVLVIALAFGGLAMALVMALQYIFADFAYVLDTPDLRDYFYRARGTAYYHAPATYTLALTMMLALGLLHARLRVSRPVGVRFWAWCAAILVLALLATLNDTRAINLALMAALGMMALLVLWRRDWITLALTVLLMIWISADMLYVKPMIGSAGSALSQSDIAFQDAVQGRAPEPPAIATDEQVELPDIGSAVDSDVPQTLVGSNSVRILLAKAGMLALPKYVLAGSGVGTLELNLGGIAGISTTYSTHMLYADMALMAGVPAAAAFALMLILAFATGLLASIWPVPDKTQQHKLAPALLSASIVLALGGVFLPQERNHIVALFFVFSALLLVMNTRFGDRRVSAAESPALAAAVRKPALATLAGVLAIAAIGWGVLTSATYTLPVLNMVAAYGDDIAASDASVFVTEPAAAPMARALLRLRGVHDPQVSILPDDPDLLPEDNAYIIWHPARERRYPNLKAALPYREVRPGSDAPSLELPSNWWMRDVVPYAGFLLQAGARPAGEVFGEALEATDVREDLPLWPDVGRFVSFAQLGDASQTSKRDMLDMNPATRRVWATSEPVSFYFDLSNLPSVPIGAYRLVPPARSDDGYSRRMSWRVHGSNDLTNWELLDARETTWSDDIEAPSGFAVSKPRVFRYLRLQFDPKITPSMVSSLGDIELYPTPMDIPAAALQSQ